jgi:hypothetical protein
MAESAITNPSAALQTVTDFRTGLDSSGAPLQQGQQGWPYRANATIEAGQALMFVAPTATVPLSVTPMTTAIVTSDPWLFAGVAADAAAAGDQVLVIRRGVCVVQHDTSDTPAAADVLALPNATTGDFATAAAVTGLRVVGTVLGPEIGTSNRCLAYLDPGIPGSGDAPA